jgi:ABC-type sugar transport system ATPase subunit
VVTTWLCCEAVRGKINALVCARADARRLGFLDGIKGKVMSLVTIEPDTELAVALIAEGHDAHYLRDHAGFATLRDAREFIARSETKTAVRRQVEERSSRLGFKSMAALERLLDSDSTDGRTRVAAARTGLEVAGLMRRDQPLSDKVLRELTVPELAELIAQTKAEIEQLQSKAMSRSQPVTLISSD